MIVFRDDDLIGYYDEFNPNPNEEDYLNQSEKDFISLSNLLDSEIELSEITLNSNLFTFCNVYNSNGQFITSFNLTQGVNTFDISYFASGVYIVQIPYSQGVVVRKLIKN